MRDFTAQEVKQVATKAGFKVFTTPYSVTLLSIRNPETLSVDVWDDKTIALWYDSSKKLNIFQCTSTTHPGINYLMKPFRGTKGPICMLDGIQFRGLYKLMDKGHNPPSGGYRAFRQVKPAEYVRDTNLNSVNDYNNLIKNPNNIIKGIFNTNLHRASQYKINNLIGPWSAGCQVIQKYEDFIQLIAIGNKQIEMGLGDTFSYGILNYNLFK
jgi:hypothetical protein